MVHQDFFSEDGSKSPHHSDLENQWLPEVHYDEDTGDQNGKPSTLPYPPLYTQYIYYYYFHNLLPTLINAPPPKQFQLKQTKRIRTWDQRRS